MSLEVQIHAAQTLILRELLFRPSAGFAELQKPTGLTSDHFNFHIKRLFELDYVKKVATGQYTLSAKGKEYANKLDTDQNTIERQPKVAVLVGISRVKRGIKEYLFHERTKHPYYGYWGFMTGKIRWGESIMEAAARELMEETGLTAKLKLQGIYHERTYSEETGSQLEDKIFFIILASNPKGKLIEKFEGGINHWTTPEVATTHKVYTSFATELAIIKGEMSFSEEIHKYKKEEF